jgi:hypothetical protein
MGGDGAAVVRARPDGYTLLLGVPEDVDRSSSGVGLRFPAVTSHSSARAAFVAGGLAPDTAAVNAFSRGEGPLQITALARPPSA